MTSKQKIINRLNETGQVDNFWCIDNRITTRLGAVIHKLKKVGWEFDKQMVEKNCVYIAKKKFKVVETQKGTVPVPQLFTYKVYEPVTKFNDPS